MPWKQSPSKIITLTAKSNAHKLRRAMTEAEKTLWKHLRGDFAGSGTHFRRQVPIGCYVADFCCLKYRLIVELDGPIHETASAKIYDQARTDALQAGGYLVLRFSNEEAILDFRSVLNRISAALVGNTPTPGPSPQGGGECAGASP
ncbi:MULTISPECIES: endonuclease domain-containing protein [unclassified Mesorhizobium]|uniref:endonuclease domain-containing protein n=1 Tax=unclassified Mesorhizobium TaxID=325217 RepID=UPI0012E3C196|nr:MULTISPECIES: DUF559 domain-containing protein [unclassified Mesorhizobium]